MSYAHGKPPFDSHMALEQHTSDFEKKHGLRKEGEVVDAMPKVFSKSITYMQRQVEVQASQCRALHYHDRAQLLEMAAETLEAASKEDVK